MRTMIAWALLYLRHYAFRNSLIVLSLSLILFIPFGLQNIIEISQQKMIARAESSALMITANDGGTDELIEALYLKSGQGNSWLKMADLDSINNHNLGFAIPVLSGFEAQEFNILGTTIDYFSYRNLSFTYGRNFQNLGECVIGNQVANQLDLKIGDSLITTPKGFFDMAGVYPLKLRIVGILNLKNNPDDQGIFTDIKTSWIIMGLGHGHEDVQKISDPEVIISREENTVKTTQKIKLYQEITGANKNDFHFHGKEDELPIRSMFFVPNSDKDLAIIRARLTNKNSKFKALVPKMVVNRLLDKVFKFQQVFNTFYIWVLFASALTLAVIFMLLIKLRESQINTLYTLGASRFQVVGSLLSELLILLIASSILAFILYMISGNFANLFIDKIIL
ncbi:MAG: ABC transporter permease [Schleiferiaceae bacterium]|nr:ABC transporter permease [Schleiferiaceae bacterium]